MRFFLFVGLVGLLLVSVVFALDKQRDCKCRIKPSLPNINGRNATGIPWQISLSLKGKKGYNPNNLPDEDKATSHFCGGVIINEQWILTAAHCFGRSDSIKDPKTLKVGFGDNDLVQIYDKNQYKPIADIHRHRLYFNELIFFNQTNFNDLALIKLAEPLTFSETVQPACLGFGERESYGRALLISGWAFNQRSVHGIIQDIERFLQEADVDDNSFQTSCHDWQHICTDNQMAKEVFCKGDPGGPIHYTENGKSSVVGIQSFHTSPLFESCPGFTIYTRLSAFKDWVEKKIGQDYCS